MDLKLKDMAGLTIRRIALIARVSGLAPGCLIAGLVVHIDARKCRTNRRAARRWHRSEPPKMPVFHGLEPKCGSRFGGNTACLLAGK